MANTRQTFADNITTDPTTSATINLAPGWWLFSCDFAAAAAWTVNIDNQEPADGTIWRPITQDGAAVQLTETAPSKLVLSLGENYRTVSAGDTSSLDVWATPVMATLVN